MASIFFPPTSNSVHCQLAWPSSSHPSFHNRISATSALHPHHQPHAHAEEQRQQKEEEEEDDDDDGEESVQSTTGSGRRGLLTGTLAAALIDCNTTRFIPSSNGAKHMARALVQTGQEKEMRTAANSAVARLESRISTFSLDNGMRWIVLERHNAPVVACRTFANVGAALEADGCTGVAHLLEHLAFKGTRLIGTRDANKEATLLDHLDEVFYSLRDAKQAGNSYKVGVLKKKFVIKEERRLRVDNAAYGRFTETFLEMGFPGFPYRRPVIGYPSDFEDIGRREVNQFFKENYTPEMLTCAVVGDVNVAEVESLARRYFGGWDLNRKKSNSQVLVVNQWHEAHGWDIVVRTNGQRFFSMKLPAQPFYMEGYYRPAASSNEDPVISMIDELLSGGRLCRFYRNIILEGKALSATSSDTYPGDQRPCLFLVYGVPAAGIEGKSLAGILHQQLEHLASHETTEEQLFRVKKASRASLLELFGSNQGMAKLLSKYEATTGSYKNLFKENELVESVTPKDICRVASRLFHPDNCISGSVTSSRD